MCGITGFIDFVGRSEKSVLQKMTDTLEHRGPDGSGTRVFENGYQVGLGHRRLSIIDLSVCGAQPMSYLHFHIVFNGEVYNYKEVRSELQLLGHSFVSESDTEVLLHAYVEFGEACLEKFRGMFAFAIYNSKDHKIFCARDRAGVKPFYYYWHAGLFLFSSELKSFLKHPLFKKEIDLAAVSLFIQFGNIPAPHCIYRNCFKLPPAHTLVLDLNSKQIRTRQYWDVYSSYNKTKLDISFTEATKKTEQILKTAFDYRMVADVPVGIFLSGGYDSACLTALLQHDRKQKLRTFTIGVPDIGLNEAPFAREVSERLGTEHTEFECTAAEAIALINDLPYYYDEPFGDSSAIPTMLVSKLARRDVTVALSADGGDEVFAGYNRYDYMLRYGKYLNAVPEFVRKAAYGVMQTVPAEKWPYISKSYNFHNRYEKTKQLLKNPSPKNIMLNLSAHYTEAELQDLFMKPVKAVATAYEKQGISEKTYSPLSYMMAIDYETYLADDILQKVDRASMSASLEAREPFLDHHIIEWAARLPDNFKYHKGVKKYILKEIVHQYLPKEMMDRPKMGFAIPIENWLMTDLKEHVNDFLKDDKIATQGIFNLQKVQELKNQFYSGKRELGPKIWYLLMFQMWYQKWMD